MPQCDGGDQYLSAQQPCAGANYEVADDPRLIIEVKVFYLANQTVGCLHCKIVKIVNATQHWLIPFAMLDSKASYMN